MADKAKDAKPRVRRVNKAEAKQLITNTLATLNKPTVTAAEIEQMTADLKSATRFLTDWSRFSG